ncbi:germinal-center associated nuclear protein-like [Xenia sp. Carnegie-2017]|uniref:germinal-center associated nuclear protein-like n=1 Tax=Xenia sp. Carnegie-2017 TaxID=2897299 RepID=UPI001F038D58|nr:germinal-center associated nuclear protein-like [Xenia sp. Carnegie-2017]
MNANQIGQKKKKQAVRRLSSSGQNARRGDIRRMLELRKNASNRQGHFRRIRPSNHGEALHEKRTNTFGSVARSNEQFPSKTNSQRHVSPLVQESFSRHLESDVVTGSTSINTRGNVFGGLQTNASVYQSTTPIGSGSSTNMKNTNVESSFGNMNNSGPQNFGVFASKQYEDQTYLKNFLSSSAPVTTIKENDLTSHVTGSNMFSRVVQPAIANNQGSNASIFNSQLESQTPIFGNTDKHLNPTNMMKPSSQNSEFLKISSNSNLGSSIFGIPPSLSDVSKDLHVSSLKNNVFGNFENLQSTSSVTIPGIQPSFKMSSNIPEISNLPETSTAADSTLLQASTSSNSREIFTKTSFNYKSGNLSSKTNEVFTSNAITHKPQTNVFSSSIANEKRSTSSVPEDKRNNGKELQIIGPHSQFANNESICSQAAPSVLNTKFSGIFSQSKKSSVDSKLTFGNVDYSDSSTNISGRDFSSTNVEHGSTMFSNSQNVNNNKKVVSTTFDRTLSGRDISDLTSIVIKGLSSRFFDRKTLLKELKKFGASKVSLQPSKGNVIVDFDSHERAGSVKGALTEIFPNENLHVFWCKKKGTRRISRTLEKANHDMTEIRSRKSSITNALNSIDVGEFPPALSATERYNILDEVDKKIREAITPYKDIKNAPVVVGVCCDMCPEKERYMRESQANLSIFEMIPETHEYRDGDVPKVDHRRAVKEYSRSAADKLEPLAHELRPVNVLHRTLDYLMCHVMNYNGDKWGEWFNFLWNRTRAIRKDITQQHLCNEESAELVEKITRFHIFCSHYLCEEDIHSFDPKINNENLTKCLQTLKQIYTDLYSEQGIKCENEAEFQAYDILLNLNEGDSLRKAMQYRVEIRNSPEVKFSLEVFSSVNTHNYIRFFKLLQSTSYLNACVMHRYFNQVRAMALKIMTRAYSANEMYPLQVLKDVLAFEDINEVTRNSFCNHFNFTVMQDALRFSKAPFVEPEMAFPSQRSMNGIESKRYCSISEIVNGCPLPVCSIHQPVSSFDSNNRYIGLNNLLSLMQNTPDTPDTLHDIHEPISNLSSVQPCPISQYFVKDAQDVFNQAVEDVMLALLNNVVYDMVKNVYEEETREVFLMKQMTKSFMETFLIESIHELLSDLAEETIEKERENLRVSRDRMTSIVRDELLYDVIKVELKNVAVQTMSDISDQMWTQSFTNMSAVVMQEIMAKMICEQCQVIATYVREDAVKKMKDELKKKRNYFEKENGKILGDLA